MKSFNLGLKLLAKFIAEKNTISPTSTANCIRAKKFVKIPLTKLLTLYSKFVNIMFTLIWLSRCSTSIGCRHLILYHLRLGPPFRNDNITLRSKVDLGPNLVKIDLKNYLWRKQNYFWKNKPIFGKERLLETLSVCTHTRVCSHTLEACIHILRVCTHIPRVCARS